MSKIILEDEEITAAEHVAAIVEGRGKTEYIGSTTVISVRLPKVLEAEVQAFAHKSSKTRNAMVAHLLEVGLNEVKKHLSDETLFEIYELMNERLADGGAE